MNRLLSSLLILSLVLAISCKSVTTTKLPTHQQRYMTKDDLAEYLFYKTTLFSEELLAEINRGKVKAYRDSGLFDYINPEKNDYFNINNTSVSEDEKSLFSNEWKTFRKFNKNNQNILEVIIGDKTFYVTYNSLLKVWTQGIHFIEYLFEESILNSEDLENTAIVMLKKWKYEIWHAGLDSTAKKLYINDMLEEYTTSESVSYWKQQLKESEEKHGKNEAFISIVDVSKVRKKNQIKSEAQAISTAHSMVIQDNLVGPFSVFFVPIQDFYKRLAPYEAKVLEEFINFHKLSLFRTGI